jgi:hypothetical protein
MYRYTPLSIDVYSASAGQASWLVGGGGGGYCVTKLFHVTFHERHYSKLIGEQQVIYVNYSIYYTVYGKSVALIYNFKSKNVFQNIFISVSTTIHAVSGRILTFMFGSGSKATKLTFY